MVPFCIQTICLDPCFWVFKLVLAPVLAPVIWRSMVLSHSHMINQNIRHTTESWFVGYPSPLLIKADSKSSWFEHKNAFVFHLMFAHHGEAKNIRKKISCFSHCTTTAGLFNTGVCDREEDGQVEENSMELMIGKVLTRKQHLFMLCGCVCVIWGEMQH